MMAPDPDDKTPMRRERLPQEKPETAVLPVKRRRLGKKSASGEVSLQNSRELLLVVRGMVERLELPEDEAIILGRSDLNARSHPDVDLTPYGALDRGVSRSHARLHIADGKLFITDLDSKNGTFIGGERLEPHVPTAMRKGVDLVLGRLNVTILFR
ncbi:FHA domain-containing protein [bacterium]|nr:FHA domain-containing protein [bacterium]